MVRQEKKERVQLSCHNEDEKLYLSSFLPFHISLHKKYHLYPENVKHFSKVSFCHTFSFFTFTHLSYRQTPALGRHKFRKRFFLFFLVYFSPQSDERQLNIWFYVSDCCFCCWEKPQKFHKTTKNTAIKSWIQPSHLSFFYLSELCKNKWRQAETIKNNVIKNSRPARGLVEIAEKTFVPTKKMNLPFFSLYFSLPIQFRHIQPLSFLYFNFNI